MKRFKKYLSLILMVIFTLSMSMAAFADTGKITIADSTNEQHQAYKIFDAVVTPIYNVDHQEVDQLIDYFIDDTSFWFDKVNGFEGLEFILYDTVPIDPDNLDLGYKNIYRVSWGTGFSAADFAEMLREYVGNSYLNPDGDDIDDVGSIEDLDYGYYLITTTKGGELQPKAALASVIKDEIIIQDKNDMPFDKTVMDEDPTTGDPIQVKEKDVKVGDTLYYTIKGKVPDTTNDTFYAYLVSDTLTEGLTFNKDVNVRIIDNTDNNDPYSYFEDVDLHELTTTAITPGNDEIKYREDGFDLSLDVLYRGQNKPGSNFTMAGFDIVITYTAVVNDKAVAEVSKNLATLDFGNNPQDLQHRDSEVKVYSSKIVIDKFENGATEQKLADAEFVLRKPVIDGTPENSYLYYRYVEENPEPTDATTVYPPAPRVEWFALTDVVNTAAFETFLTSRYMTLADYNTLSAEERENIAIEYAVEQGLITKVTTDKDGVAEFKGLEDGKYELVEIKAPSGYTLLAAPVVVEVDGTDATTVGLTQEQSTVLLTEIAHIANTPGQLIPSTGGMGTTLFYIVGAIMVFGAVVVLVTRRKMSE